MGFTKTKKTSLAKDAVPTLFSFKKLAVPSVLSERRANVMKRNRLVACHTDSFLIISIEIKIVRPDLNQTYEYCVIFTYIILVYVTENIIQLHVIT